MTIDPTYATSDPPAITPNPAIHNVPPQDSPSTQEIGVIGRAHNLSTGTANGVASALVGGLGAGANPFAALASFGAEALQAIADIATLILKTGAEVIDDVANFIVSAVQGVANIIGAIIQGLGGILGGTGTAADAQLVLQATAATIAATNTAVQSMQAQDAADSNNGINVFLNFSTATLAGFTETYTPAGYGTLGINSSGYAQLNPSGTANFTGLALHPTPTNTDDQIVSAVYYNAPGSYNYFNLSEGSGYDILIGRSNASMTTYVYAEISPILYSIHNVVNGTDTVLAQWTPSEPTFYAGAAYSLSCGFDGNNHPLLQIIVNGVAILEYLDTSGVTNYGAAYRYCGFGLAQNAGMAPSQMASFGFVDDAPGPIIGDVFQAGNLSTTAITLANNINCTLAPANYFNNIQAQTSNYTYDPSTNKLTVHKSAIYNVRVMTQWVPKSGASYAYFGVGIFKNGLLYDTDVMCLTSPGALPYYIQKGASFIGVQLDAGDYIQPGFVSYSNSSSYPNTIVGGGSTDFFCEIANTGTAG